MMSYKIHLIRHGETIENSKGRYIGITDAILSDDGINKLKQLANITGYPPVDTLYTSPLTRCVETAKIIYPNISANKNSGLCEYNFGEYENKTYEQLKDQINFIDWLKGKPGAAPPNGEKPSDFTRRILTTFSEIIENSMRLKEFSVGIITHGAVIMALVKLFSLETQPIYHWFVDNGYGFTLITNARMWQNDKLCELSHQIPAPVGPSANKYMAGEDIE